MTVCWCYFSPFWKKKTFTVLLNWASCGSLKLKVLCDQVDFYAATLCYCSSDVQKWKMMSPVGCCDSLDKCHFLPVAIWWLPFHHFCRRRVRSSVWRHTFDSGCVALGWYVSYVTIACVPKVITGMADEFCCPEAPKVVDKMALRMQRAHHSVGGD